MFKNYLAAALRNLARNRLYSAVNVIGFAVALAAALVIALFVRDETSFEHFIPGYQDVYRISTNAHLSFGDQITENASPDVAGWLRLDFPSIMAVARLLPRPETVRHGDIESPENVMWADPDFFALMPLPVVAGDLQTALQKPDAVVLTRALARKYFGQDAPIGATLEMNRRYPMRVAAVIEDLPSNTHLGFQMVASGLASFSFTAEIDSASRQTDIRPWSAFTYFRLRPGTSVASIERAMPQFIGSHMPAYLRSKSNPVGITFSILPIAAIHLHSFGLGTMRPPGSIEALYAMTTIGILIVSIASANFVNLMTARAARRAIEVGIRKAAGARRRDLLVQFIGEALVYVFLAAGCGVVLVELALPRLDALLGRTIVFAYWRDPMFMGSFALSLVVLGVAAGSYPALVLSTFRPATVLRGATVRIGAGGASQPARATLRQSLVIMQFAVLIGLLLATGVIWRQTAYAIDSSLRSQTAQMLLLQAPCKDFTLKQELQALPGVSGAACSNQLPIWVTTPTEVINRLGSKTTLYYNSVDAGYFELYGLQPVAGRFFSADRAADRAPADWSHAASESIVVNETAVRKLGFKSPEAALGQSVTWNRMWSGGFTPPHTASIIGVVPDFPMGSIRQLIQPAAFYFEPPQMTTLNVKLKGENIPETLRSIRKLWVKLGPPAPMGGSFLRQAIEFRYRDLTRQGFLFALFAGLTLLIACLGIFGLSVFIAGQRTKEIGIRKALGAYRWDIVRLLTWQFSRPVIWANLLAWPAAGLVMRHWLGSFAYHISLAPWMFVAAGAMALVIAVATTGIQALIASSTVPVTALRNE